MCILYTIFFVPHAHENYNIQLQRNTHAEPSSQLIYSMKVIKC